MLTFKKSVAVFLSFLTCLIVCMPALADIEQPPVSPRSTLFINYAILSATNASAQGGSSQNESVTVSFVLYHSDGIYVTSVRWNICHQRLWLGNRHGDSQ